MAEPWTATIQTASDADLVQLVLGKSEAAARALMRRYNQRLYRVARSMVGDDAEAEDVLQEAYLSAFAMLASFRGDASLATWLTRIVINEALQRLRRRTDVPTPNIDKDIEQRNAEVIPFPPTGADPERTIAQRELCRLVEKAIDALPSDYRIVLIARAIEGLSVEETAAAFGLNEETVKTRLHRARRLLREALAAHIGPRFGDLFPFAGMRCERITAAVVERLDFKNGGNV